MKASLKAMIPALALAGALLLTPSAEANDRRGYDDGYRGYSQGYGRGGYSRGYGRGHYGKGYGHRYYRGYESGYYARPYRYYRPYGRAYYAPPPYYSPYPQPYYYGYGPGYYAPPPPVYGPRFGIGLFFGF